MSGGGGGDGAARKGSIPFSHLCMHLKCKTATDRRESNDEQQHNQVM